MIYYISDIHFNDQKIFDKCKRPFKSLDEMKETIIKKWNNKVKDTDIVYVLGDIGKDDDPATIDIFKKLKGHKHLIVGNHDQFLNKAEFDRSLFDSIKDIDIVHESLEGNNYGIVLCHYPIQVWYKQHYGYLHFYRTCTFKLRNLSSNEI